MPNPGDLIGGRLRLLRYAPPGVGSPLFGPAFIARDQQSGSESWLTAVGSSLLPAAVDMSAFMAAANELPAIRHPGLVRVTEVDREDRFAVVGYEVLPSAKSLSMMKGKRVPRSTVLRRGAELVRSLAHLHQRGTVHGVLSFETVVVWEGAALVWQHGLAADANAGALAEAARRASGDLLLAPELTRGEPLTPRTDLYCWAVLIAQLASGLGAVDAVVAAVEGDGSELAVDGPMLEILRGCLEQDAGLRPPDAGQLLLLLEEEGLLQAGNTAESVNKPSAPASTISADDAAFLATFLEDDVPGVPAPPPMATPLEGPEEIEPEYFDLTESEHDDGAQVPVPRPAPRVSSVPVPPPAAEQVRPSPQKPRKPTAQPEARVVPRKAPPRPSPIKASQSSAELDALIGLHAEEPAGAPARPEPKLEELALQAARVDEIRVPKSALLATESGTAPAAKSSGAFRAPVEHMVHVDTPVRGIPLDLGRGARSRREGPFGPGPGVMGFGMALVCTACCLLVAAHVALERGTEVFALQLPVAARHGGIASNEEGQETENAGTDGLALEDGDATGAAVPTPAAQTPAAPKDCPEGAVELDDRVCIAAYEHPGQGRPPTTKIDKAGAQAACEELGARLCSAKEWRHACGGPEKLAYPYGARAQDGVCLTASIAGFPQAPEPAGSRQNCKSPVGAYDLVGNVAEWVSDGVVVGGDGVTPGPDANCRLSKPAPADFTSANVGFRCCVDRI